MRQIVSMTLPHARCIVLVGYYRCWSGVCCQQEETKVFVNTDAWISLIAGKASQRKWSLGSEALVGFARWAAEEAAVEAL